MQETTYCILLLKRKNESFVTLPIYFQTSQNVSFGSPVFEKKKSLGFVGVDTIFVSIQAIRYTVYPISCIFGWLNTHLCCSKKYPATILPNQYCGLNLIWPIEVAINWGDTLLPTNIDVETPPFANGFPKETMGFFHIYVSDC